jgi:two-component system nitrogen regulation response regulator GlnG/two-component system response regulator HydG
VSASSETVSEPHWLAPSARQEDGEDVTALVIVWSLAEPWRVGEVALLPGDGAELVLGRGEAEGGAARAQFQRQRPGSTEPTGPLLAPGISRDQLRLRAEGETLVVERIGRRELLLNGRPAPQGVAHPGDTVSLGNQLVLLCSRRPRRMAPLRSYDIGRARAFGRPDEHGIVGESPAAWRLRDELAFAAASDVHVLLLGESGSGKELAASAVHRLSCRGSKPMVARNAATFPAELIDAELFGNVKDFPNPGMAERPGLIGEADGTTLFLDEIAEMPSALQAHLLRVLDAAGEYQRLGEPRSRRANLRLIAATNRAPEELKHDIAARLVLRIHIPGLGDRREDVPLAAAHLLRRAAAANGEIGARFFEGWDGKTGEPRIDPELVEHLVRRPFSHHMRELDGVLWQAIGASREKYIELPGSLKDRTGSAAAAAAPRGSVPPCSDQGPAARRREPSREEILAALEKHGGTQAAAWQELGLPSRFALYRLLKRYNI